MSGGGMLFSKYVHPIPRRRTRNSARVFGQAALHNKLPFCAFSLLLWVPAVRRSAYTRFSNRSMESGLLLLIVSSDDPSSLPQTPKWKKLREERS